MYDWKFSEVFQLYEPLLFDLSNHRFPWNSSYITSHLLITGWLMILGLTVQFLMCCIWLCTFCLLYSTWWLTELVSLLILQHIWHSPSSSCQPVFNLNLWFSRSTVSGRILPLPIMTSLWRASSRHAIVSVPWVLWRFIPWTQLYSVNLSNMLPQKWWLVKNYESTFDIFWSVHPYSSLLSHWRGFHIEHGLCCPCHCSAHICYMI